MGNAQKVRKYDLYGFRKLPESNDVAIGRLNELLEKEEYIKVQIEFNKQDGFVSEEDYIAWKQKAFNAIASTRREIKFLGCWLEGRPGIDPLVNKQIQTRCEDIVSTHLANKSSLLSEDMPTSKIESKEKYSELGRIINEIGSNISEIKGILSDGVFPQDKVRKIVYPLVNLIVQLVKKRRQLKKIFTPA